MRFGTSGRAVISGPGTIGIDLSVRKRFRFTESKYLQFRTELFNAFNHPNLLPPNKRLGDGNLGRVTAARDPRIIQFGLKFAF
jgi:hypothetical protein